MNCGDAVLRDINSSDTDTLMAIHESLRYYEDISGEPFTAASAQALICKTDLPPDGNPEFYLAKMIQTTDRRPVGYIMLYEGYPQPDTLWVGAFFIHREKQHKGFGGTVMRAINAQAGLVGFTHIGLGVYAQNTSGLSFWVSQGYRRIEQVKVSGDTRAILGLSKQVSTTSE